MWRFESRADVRTLLELGDLAGQAWLQVHRAGGDFEQSLAMRVVKTASGPWWRWVCPDTGELAVRLYLAPKAARLCARGRGVRDRRSGLPRLDAAHARLIHSFAQFGIVWTGDEAIPSKPDDMWPHDYRRHVSRIRRQWVF